MKTTVNMIQAEHASIGTCSECGQSRAYDDLIGSEEACRRATMECTCKEGAPIRRRMRRVLALPGTIQSLFGENCLDRFHYKMDDAVCDLLNGMANWMMEHQTIRKVTLELGDNDRAIFTMKEDLVSVKRECKVTDDDSV